MDNKKEYINNEIDTKKREKYLLKVYITFFLFSIFTYKNYNIILL